VGIAGRVRWLSSTRGGDLEGCWQVTTADAPNPARKGSCPDFGNLTANGARNAEQIDQRYTSIKKYGAMK